MWNSEHNAGYSTDTDGYGIQITCKSSMKRLFCFTIQVFSISTLNVHNMSLVTGWTQAVESWKCWKMSSLTLQVSRSPETSSGRCRQSGGSQSPSNHCRPASSSVLHGLHLRSHAIHLVCPRYDPPQHNHGHVHQRLSHPQRHRCFRQPMVFEPWPDQMGSTRGIQPSALHGRGWSA